MPAIGALNDAETAPATPVVVMTHHFLHDLNVLQFLLPTDAPYIGLLGPRQRYENLLAELARREKKQLSLHLKRARASDIVCNGSGMDALESQVRAAFSQIVSQVPHS
mgnify:CR=1 FL=1